MKYVDEQYDLDTLMDQTLIVGCGSGIDYYVRLLPMASRKIFVDNRAAMTKISISSTHPGWTRGKFYRVALPSRIIQIGESWQYCENRSTLQVASIRLKSPDKISSEALTGIARG